METATLLAGVIAPPVIVSVDDARRTCPAVIASSVLAYAIQGPRGDTRFEQTCVVGDYRELGRVDQSIYTYGRYRVTSVFSPEDPARGPTARDTVPEEVVVLFRGTSATQRVAVWQMRYEIGSYGILRSITPQVAGARIAPDAVLLRVEACVNGTGGCGQDFLYFRRGAWVAVDEAWWRQLPSDIRSRVLHGIQIDARTLRAEGGLYRPGDPNCCPSDVLTAQLQLVGDSLILHGYQVRELPR